MIPTVSWSDARSYAFCFDGIEKGSVVAVSTLGSRRIKEAYLSGFHAMFERVSPSHVICYYEPFEEMRELVDITVIPYDGIAIRKAKHAREPR